MTLFATGFPWWAFDLPFWSVVVFVMMIAVMLAFVRKPLVTGMKNRQLEVLNGLRRAENVRREVEHLREQHNRERQQFEREIAEMLAEAKRDAQTFSARLVERAKDEGVRITGRSQREIGLLKQKVMMELWQTTANLSSGATERVLAVDLSAADHRRLIDAALREIVLYSGGAA